MTRTTQRLIGFSFVALLFYNGNALGVPITVPVLSTFDSDADGWTGDNPGEFTFAAFGGNPGGFLRFDDIAPVGGFMFAPAKFLGDWSALDGVGSIIYDHRVIDSGKHTGVVPRRIVLSGPGGVAIWTGPIPSCVAENCSTPWETFTAPLDESAWTVGSGSWNALLAEVTAFRIVGDHYTSITFSTANEEGFDNIQVVPEPSTFVLGIIGLSCCCRRRKRR